MKHSFFLKNPQKRTGNKPSLILFTCHFNQEKKKFVYSTGEKIAPIHWNFAHNQPKSKGSLKSPTSKSIKMQLDRYSNKFESLQALYSKIGEDLTSKILKEEFDKEFKKIQTANTFFAAYDLFMEEKEQRREWKPATVKRYTNIKNILLGFEEQKKYSLTFSKINNRFYTLFTDYCYTKLDHATNTFSRNIGLFKTFMLWSLQHNFTYNDEFKNFKKPERVITKEIALTLDQVENIFEFQLESRSLERVRDVFVFQCLTGLRFGELKLINDRTIINEAIVIKEDKDIQKDERVIPLFNITSFILKKYNNQLPILSNQKHNEFIKQLFEKAEFTFDVEFSRNQNKQKTTIVKPFYKGISTHTARRTFITIMKNKGIADKTIMKMTGHKDLKTFNTYYKVDITAKKDALELAFGSMKLPKLKSV